MNVDNVFLGIDKAISCSLIMDELVSNFLKHAFPEDKKVKSGLAFMRMKTICLY